MSTTETVTVKPVESVGVQPKVTYPAIALFVAGVILIVLGIAFDDEQMRNYGFVAIGSSGVSFGTGWLAPIGRVLIKLRTPSSI